MYIAVQHILQCNAMNATQCSVWLDDTNAKINIIITMQRSASHAHLLVELIA